MRSTTAPSSGQTLLTQSLAMLSVLTLVVLLAGFGSTTLHARPSENEFATERRRWKE